MMTDSVKIGVIGDIHLSFDEWDIHFFNSSDYDLLLFVGDLSKLWRPTGSLVVAELLSKLKKPALLIPGNHDVHNVFQLVAEVLDSRGLSKLSGLFHYAYHERLASRLFPVVMSGYGIHFYRFRKIQFDVITSRPYAMGGSALSFAPLLARQYQVQNLDDSIALLCQQVDAASSNNLVFLAHNGPAGLGNEPIDIWGCDFDPSKGDFGDKDLTAALEYARIKGKHILAVFAGHMHLQTYLGPKPFWQRKGVPGPHRPWQKEMDGVQYINAGWVPRIFSQGSKVIRHHIQISFNDDDLVIKEMFIETPNQY
jgi:uncharacterized protein (TIGR04168 family)